MLRSEDSPRPPPALPRAQFKGKHPTLTSRPSMEEAVALAAAFALGTYGHRLCMEDSLAAQRGLLQLLPALSFGLFSSREHLGRVAIKTRFTMSPKVSQQPPRLPYSASWGPGPWIIYTADTPHQSPRKQIGSRSVVHFEPMVSQSGSESAFEICNF